MEAYDRHRLLSALMLLVIALFVSGGLPQTARWRPQLRIATIALFGIAMAAALVEIGLWWAGFGR